MQDFTYYTPTKVVFGKGVENTVGKYVKDFGGTKVLVHYGSKSAKASGLIDRVGASLEKEGISYVELGGVVSHPRLSLVYEGIELGKKEGVDFILAVGGGSVIDSSKAIAYGIANPDIDVWDFFVGKAAAKVTLKVGSVLTIAAAGSEMSKTSVISNLETGQKIGYGNDISRPVFAMMNPELTLTLPEKQTMSGCIDVLMHTMERYFSPDDNPMEVTLGMAESLMRTVMENTRKLARNLQDYDARAEIMWAGSLSHNGLTECGNGHGDWAVHQFGHDINVLYDEIPHGSTLAMAWGSWARYVYKEYPERFARFGVNVLDLEPLEDDEATALATIDEMENFFWSVGLPTSFAEAGKNPTDEEIHSMAVGCSRNYTRTIGAIKVLQVEDMEKVYRMMRDEAGVAEK